MTPKVGNNVEELEFSYKLDGLEDCLTLTKLTTKLANEMTICSLITQKCLSVARNTRSGYSGSRECHLVRNYTVGHSYYFH